MAFAHPKKNIAELGLKEGERVADFGAGPGHYTIPAAKAVGEDGHVYAIEIQKKLVSKVEGKADKAGLSNVNVIWADLEKPEGSTLDDGLVDVVIASNILFQIDNKKQFFQETYRVLKDSGRLLVIDWSDSHGGLGPNQEHLVSEDTVRSHAKEVGLNAQQVLEPGAHHYGIVFQKQ
jgi:ubiquinone/menaquinone biosynthesis C-methylase UbiE